MTFKRWVRNLAGAAKSVEVARPVGRKQFVVFAFGSAHPFQSYKNISWFSAEVPTVPQTIGINLKLGWTQLQTTRLEGTVTYSYSGRLDKSIAGSQNTLLLRLSWSEWSCLVIIVRRTLPGEFRCALERTFSSFTFALKTFACRRCGIFCNNFDSLVYLAAYS